MAYSPRMKIDGSGTCKCGHRWLLHKYWREDGFNSGACEAWRGKCPCLVYDDVEWEDTEEEEVVVQDEDWDLI